MYKRLGAAIIILSLVGIFFSIKLGAESVNYLIVRKIDFKQSIENAAQVQGLENKFVYIQAIGWGGAGAGGIGAPQISINSAEQFLSLVPKNEQIYSAVRYQTFPNGADNETVVEKVYWAFIENRAGLNSYTEQYSYKNIVAKSFDDKSAYFEELDGVPWYNSGNFTGLLFMISLVMAVVGVMLRSDDFYTEEED